MTTLLENPVPIFAVGAVLATLCGLAFLARRNLPSLLAFVGVIVVTLVLAIVEQIVVTDREQVEAAVGELMAALERNDLPGVLARLDPRAKTVRADAQTLMPLVNVEDTGATSLQVDVYEGDGQLTADTLFLGKVDGIHKRSGQRVFYFDQVTLHWIKRGDRWLVESYEALWRGRPINAVESMRANRPTPTL